MSTGGEALPPGHDRYPGRRPWGARALLDTPPAPARPGRGPHADVRPREAL